MASYFPILGRCRTQIAGTARGYPVERSQRDLADPYSVAVEGIQAASDNAAKRAEIERTKAAVYDRLKAGYDQGRPLFGMQFDDNGRYWVPGKEFSTALEVIDLRDAGDSYRAIEDRTGVPYSTARRIAKRRERYLLAEEKRAL